MPSKCAVQCAGDMQCAWDVERERAAQCARSGQGRQTDSYRTLHMGHWDNPALRLPDQIENAPQAQTGHEHVLQSELRIARTSAEARCYACCFATCFCMDGKFHRTGSRHAGHRRLRERIKWTKQVACRPCPHSKKIQFEFELELDSMQMGHSAVQRVAIGKWTTAGLSL